MNQRTLILILVAVLLAATAVGAGVLSLLPAEDLPAPLLTEPEQEGESVAPVPSAAPDQVAQVPSNTPAGFNIAVFQRAAFQLLNLQPLTSGLLPVRPPQDTGKANPFL